MKKTAVFFGILLVGILAAIPLRTCIILYDIDPKTGFYYNSSTLVTVTNVLLLAVCLLLIFPMFMKSYKNLEAAPARSSATGIVSAILAGIFFADAIHEFYLVMIRQGGAGTFFNSIFEIFAAAFFIFFAVASFKGGRIAFPAASLLPVIWATIHLMATFMHYTTIANVSSYLYDMLKMVFVMLFFYYHARYTGRVVNSKEIKGMLAFGLPAIFFSVVSTVPRYFAFAAGNKISINLSEDLLFLMLAVYIAVLLIRIFYPKADHYEKAVLPDGENA